VCAGRPKALVLNYPNNPTRATATADFSPSGRVREAEQIVVIHDAAYAALVFGRRAAQLSRTPARRTSASSCIRQQDFQQ